MHLSMKTMLSTLHRLVNHSDPCHPVRALVLRLVVTRSRCPKAGYATTVRNACIDNLSCRTRCRCGGAHTGSISRRIGHLISGPVRAALHFSSSRRVFLKEHSRIASRNSSNHVDCILAPASDSIASHIVFLSAAKLNLLHAYVCSLPHRRRAAVGSCCPNGLGISARRRYMAG